MQTGRLGNVLFTEEEIRRRVDQLVGEIAADCDPARLVLIGILRGSFIFLADLVRACPRHGLHPRIDFITLSSYGAATESSGTVQLQHDISETIEGADVVIVDDILDSGRTLSFARDLFRQRGAASVKTCVLLDKPARRAVDIHADYTGFEIQNLFVAGYGLDCGSRFRELPQIAVVEFD